MDDGSTAWLTWQSPIWLLAAPTGVAVTWGLWGLSRRMGRGRMTAFSAALNGLAMAMLFVALAGPAVLRPSSRRLPWLLLRDVSLSTRGQEYPLATDAEQFRTQRFAAELLAADQPPRRAETNLAPGLRYAIGQADRIAGVVIVTDGRFDDPEDWPAPADRLGSLGLEVRVVPLDSPPIDARIAAVAGRRLNDGRAEIRLDLAANALLNRAVELWDETTDPPIRLEQRGIRLLPGRPSSFVFEVDIEGERVGRWRAKLLPHDTIAENDDARILLPPLRRQVAVVAPKGHLPLQPDDVVKPARLSPDDAPRDAAGWGAYAAVILADPDGELLGDEARRALADYVRGGGGLVLVGTGPHRTPADLQGPLNRVSPLRPSPFRRNPLAVTLVLDASGSMAQPAKDQPPGTRKFDLAAEAALALKNHLTPADALRVFVFSDKPRNIFAEAGDVDFSRLAEVLRSVHPNGPTHVGEALSMAADDPAATPPRRGLVIVLSDLATREFDARALAERFRTNRAQLAVVATGGETLEDPDRRSSPEPLVSLARRLDAPLVRRDHLRGLAEVFGRFCREARGDLLAKGEFEINASPAWPRAAELQTVRGQLRMIASPRAEVVADTGVGPLLGIMRAGLGRSMTLAGSPMSEDNPQWETGSGLSAWRAFLRSAVQHVRREGNDPRISVDAWLSEGRMHIELVARENGRSLSELDLRARLLPMDEAHNEDVREEQMPLIAPGRYALDMPTDAGSKAWGVEILHGAQQLWSGMVDPSLPREVRRLGADYSILRELAERTGGRIVSAEALGDDLQHRLARQRRPLWTIALGAAVALMLLGWVLPAARRG